jgi:outer membrane protein with beta-barrel domain
MKRPSFACAVLALALAALTVSAAAEDQPATPGDQTQKWALGLGVGLVRWNDQGNLYVAANLRRLVHFKTQGLEGSGDASSSGGDPDQGRRGRVYVEPEVGYWKHSEQGLEDKDLLAGVNLVGVVPTRAFEIFLGVGFGAHFRDHDVLVSGVVTTESHTRFGGNVQFGVEADISKDVGIFGAGRVDLVEETPSQQSKVWGGLRFRF